LSAVLYASTSARDTDWFVHLLDVDPDGHSHDLWSNSSGVVRARYRDSLTKPELLEPGKIYRYDLDLWHTGIALGPGHRLRVVISSAAFPNFSRNLNPGGDNQTETTYVLAHQTIYHDAEHPSYILLPSIPEPSADPRAATRPS
jgi:putative CocE/NonD family hydrolase